MTRSLMATLFAAVRVRPTATSHPRFLLHNTLSQSVSRIYGRRERREVCPRVRLKHHLMGL